MAIKTQRENLYSITYSFTRPGFKMIVLMAIFALTLSVVRVAAVRSSRPLVGQGYMYKEIALALASGQGYSETHGAWRGHPTITRAPLWPYVLSVPIRICPQCNPVAVTQYAAAFMHAVTAFGVALLVGMLSGSHRRMLLALMVTALLPEVQPLLLGGYCEPLAAAILVIGIFLICRGDRFFWSGVLLLSLLPLVRPNFLLLWVGVMALIWWQSRGSSRFVFGNKRQLIAATLLFYIPSAIWVGRNYLVSGAFPILAGTAGMTFYGNYNSLSATRGSGFGRWVNPDRIPGEEKLADLSKRMSEAEVIRYYDSKGKQFISQHWRVVPLLIVAHVVNSALPSPSDGAHRYSFWFLRLAFYAVAFVAVWRKWIRLDSWFGVLLLCSVLMTAITVVLYSGEGRYLYPLTVLFLAVACATPYQLFALSSKSRQSSRVANRASA